MASSKKRNQQYWEDRAADSLVENEQKAKQAMEKLQAAYRAAAKQLDTEIKAFYQQFAKQNKLDYGLLRQKIDSSELRTFKQWAADTEKLLTEFYDPAYKKRLDSLKDRKSVTRKEVLFENIRYELEKLTAELTEARQEVMEEIYTEAYYQAQYETQSRLGFAVEFDRPGTQGAAKASQMDWQGYMFSSSVWNNKNKMIEELQRIILKGFITGESLQKLSTEMSAKLNTNYNNAFRIVRTETNRVANAARRESLMSAGVENYRYVATLDNRTSVMCQELDGFEGPYSQAEAGINFPPMHPNCRSTTIAVLDAEKLTERAAKDQNGKNITVPATMTYKQWYEKYGKDSR